MTSNNNNERRNVHHILAGGCFERNGQSLDFVHCALNPNGCSSNRLLFLSSHDMPSERDRRNCVFEAAFGNLEIGRCQILGTTTPKDEYCAFSENGCGRNNDNDLNTRFEPRDGFCTIQRDKSKTFSEQPHTLFGSCFNGSLDTTCVLQSSDCTEEEQEEYVDPIQTRKTLRSDCTCANVLTGACRRSRTTHGNNQHFLYYCATDSTACTSLNNGDDEWISIGQLQKLNRQGLVNLECRLCQSSQTSQSSTTVETTPTVVQNTPNVNTAPVSNDNNNNSNSPAVIAGVIIAVVLGLAVIAAVVWKSNNQRRRQQQQQLQEQPTETNTTYASGSHDNQEQVDNNGPENESPALT